MIESLFTAAISALIAAGAALMPLCPTEDSTFCHWDGGENQQGSQVINFGEGVWINY